MDYLAFIIKYKDTPLITTLLLITFIFGKIIYKKFKNDLTKLQDILNHSSSSIEKSTSQNISTLEDHAKFIFNLHKKLNALKLSSLNSHLQIKEDLLSIESNLKKLNKQIVENLITMESHATFISNLKNDLTELYGNIERLDKNKEGLQIEVTGIKNNIDDIKKILVAHNTTIKNIKKSRES